MNLSFIQLGLLGYVRLLTSALVAGWMTAPMSWSPDGEWLSYTVVTNPEPDELRPGWIFLTSNSAAETSDKALAPSGGAPGPVHRIWATHRDHQPSVLIEESHWPLTAPAWSPRGKSIAFGRFVPQSIEPARFVQRGRFDVVIQDGLERKHIVWSSPDFELDPVARASLPHLRCSWSPDGLYLAIPRPGPRPAVEIVRTDTMKRLHVIEDAIQPVWSPDGSKCAFIRRENDSSRLEYVARRGPHFGDATEVHANGLIPSSPYWSSDSRSIFAVVERMGVRSPELEIVRFILDPRESIKLISMIPESAKRAARIRGVVLDFDREAERCFFAVDLEGRDSDVVWSIPRERVTHKRFPPLDNGQRVEGLSVSPDGQLVAVRFGSSGGLTPPALYDSETEQTTLLIPDLEARREWLSVLADRARHILMTSLPPAMADGQASERPTLLPLPKELTSHDTAAVRLSRLARFGSSLCSLPADHPESGERQDARSADIETRLFFNYLRGDYQAAAADLDNLEPLLASPRQRLALLALRAQLFWARGQRSEARASIAHLLACTEPNRQVVEETPAGLVLSPYISPQQAWARYLSAREAESIPEESPRDNELEADIVDPRLQDPAAAPGAPFIERGAVAIPFAPFAPVRDFP